MRYKYISNEPYVRHRITFPYCYVDNAFTDVELDTIENYCETFDKEKAKTFSMENSQSLRTSKVAWFNRQQHPDLNILFDKLNQSIENLNNNYYNFDLNGYHTIQYTHYDGDELGTYGYHIDMNIGKYEDENNSLSIFGDTRKLSLSLFLSDSSSYDGGNFTMKISDQSEFEIEQVRGRIVVFPSFILHKVHPVTKGIRKSIVTWVEGPKFI